MNVNAIMIAFTIVTLATNQISIIAYALAVLGIVIPLILIAWGGWLFVPNQARSREDMWRRKTFSPVTLATQHLSGHAPKAAL
jgi:hypothetical protein